MLHDADTAADAFQAVVRDLGILARDYAKTVAVPGGRWIGAVMSSRSAGNPTLAVRTYMND